MVSIGGKPILQHTVEWLRGYGITEIKSTFQMRNTQRVPDCGMRNGLTAGKLEGLKPRWLNLKAEVHGEAVTLSSLILSTTIMVIFGREFPPAVLLLDWLLCLVLVGGVGLAIRAVSNHHALRLPVSDLWYHTWNLGPGA